MWCACGNRSKNEGLDPMRYLTEPARKFWKLQTLTVILLLLVFGLLPGRVCGQTANQIFIDQVSGSGTGSNLTLTAVQIGSANLIAGSNAASTQAPAPGNVPFAILAGDDQNIVIEQFGIGNAAFLDIIGGNAVVQAVSVGDQNELRLECSDSGATCGLASIDLNVTGDTNTLDYLFGDNVATDSLSLTFTINGSGNRAIDLADYGANTVNSASLIIGQRTITLDGGLPPHLERDINGDITFSTSSAAPTDGAQAFVVEDFAQTNSIDGLNQTVDILIFGDGNTMTTEIAGSNHTLQMAVDGDNSVLSVRMGGDNSVVDLRLEGDNANVAVISSDILGR